MAATTRIGEGAPGPGRPREERVTVAVLEAVVALVTETGLDAVTMDAVAARAGVSKPAIYRRWPTKQDLVIAAAETRVPPAGGDTLWADMGAAYDNLPGELKARIADLTAVHDWVPSWGSVMTPEQIAALRPGLPPVEHPLVVRHPRSGRRLLYVNEPFTTRISGLSDAESRELLSELVLQARIPEYQVRFRWQPDSVAIWDNIATQHYAINDYYPQRRVMERIAIAGVPLS
jgi:alpha-ketoglutarate-dependent taurine dioxygenase